MTGQLVLDLEPRRDLIARLREAGVPATVPISLHRNRRVMLSLNGRRLRVHEGYARAPDPVIEAIARWARPSARRSVRREAARVFLEFPVHGDLPPPPARRRPDRAEPGDEERLARLRVIHDGLNERFFDGDLGVVPIELSGRMRRKLGHYQPVASGGPVIAIGRRHLRRDGWAAVEQTLLHEMVHQWQDESGLPVDHGPGFRRKAREVGIEPRATMTR